MFTYIETQCAISKMQTQIKGKISLAVHSFHVSFFTNGPHSMLPLLCTKSIAMQAIIVNLMILILLHRPSTSVCNARHCIFTFAVAFCVQSAILTAAYQNVQEISAVFNRTATKLPRVAKKDSDSSKAKNKVAKKSGKVIKSNKNQKTKI